MTDLYRSRARLDVTATGLPQHTYDRKVLIKGGLADRVLAAARKGESFRDTVYRLLNTALDNQPLE
jgi:hypothetical protein